MNSAKISVETDESVTTSASSRKAYCSPVLTTYGQVKQLTLGTTITVNGDGGQAMMDANPSDRRLKENIVRLDTHPAGFGLYLFDYRPEFNGRYGAGRQFGVMADEVEQVLPAAVSVADDGFKRVNYTMLGIDRRFQ